MDRIVCPNSGHLSYDSAGVAAHIATLTALDPHGTQPPVYRCPDAFMHPDRPYHVGVRRPVRRAA